LEQLHRVSGEGRACALFKLGTMLLTVVGDTSGIAGASFFTYTRDANGLSLFLGSWAVQYALSAIWVNRGKRFFEDLSQSTATSLADSDTLRVTGS
jgi:hypothetical protein